MPTATIDDRDWSALSTGARIRQLEVEGYLLLPDLLDPDHVARLKAITATFDTKAVDYSENQRGRPGIQFDGGEITALIGHPPTLALRKRGRPLVHQAVRHGQSVQRAAHPVVDPVGPGPGRQPGGPGPEAEVLDHRQVVVEGRPVSQQGHPAADRPTSGSITEVVAQHGDRPRLGTNQPGTQAQQRRLAGPVRAADQDGLTGADGQVDTRQGGKAPQKRDRGAQLDHQHPVTVSAGRTLNP